jgi:hypothetical protein
LWKGCRTLIFRHQQCKQKFSKGSRLTSTKVPSLWLQQNLQTFAFFWDSRFKILRKSSWIQALRSWGSGCQSGLGFKNFSSESCILNLGSRKICKRLQFFWDSRFKIQDNFWGFNVCVCAHECLHGYWNSIIYIYGTPHKSTKTWPKTATNNISSKCV